MARFTVIAESGSAWLDGVISQLRGQPYHHTYFECPPNVAITRPLHHRNEEWPQMSKFLDDRGIDVVLMTPYIDAGMPMSPYLLGITRNISNRGHRIRTIMLAANADNIYLPGLLEKIDHDLLKEMTFREAASKEFTEMIQQIVDGRHGEVVFADDNIDGFVTLNKYVNAILGKPYTPKCFPFTEAHDYLSRCNPDDIACIALDVVEKPMSWMVGGGMLRAIKSTPRLRAIPVITFSFKMFSMNDIYQAVAPFDDAFVVHHETLERDVKRIDACIMRLPIPSPAP